MLPIILFAAQLAGFPCYGDKVCEAANEFARSYAAWTARMNATRPGTVDAREPALWREVERAFQALRTTRKEVTP